MDEDDAGLMVRQQLNQDKGKLTRYYHFRCYGMFVSQSKRKLSESELSALVMVQELASPSQ